MTAPPTRPRTIVAVAAVVVVVLAVVSATLIVGVADRRATVRNGAFGSITCAAPDLTGRKVDVVLSDGGSSMMGGGRPMMVTLRANPGTVPAGQVSFVVHNRGALAHELVILPLPADGPGTRSSGADGRVDESGSLGEASASCADGAGDGIAPGSTGWVTLTLVPGRYELICNEPWHYAGGMFDLLTAT